MACKLPPSDRPGAPEAAHALMAALQEMLSTLSAWPCLSAAATEANGRRPAKANRCHPVPFSRTPCGLKAETWWAATFDVNGCKN